MRIKEIKATPINIPLARTFEWYDFTEKDTASVIVEVLTDEGITGIGECPVPVGHNTAVRELLERKLIPLCLGEDPFNIERIVGKIESGYRSYWYKNYIYAGSAIEIALYDIVGKVLRTPVYNLLGGKTRHSVRYVGEVEIASQEENAIAAKRLVDQGFQDVRLKVGRDEELDVARIKSVREAVGEKINLKVDANGLWSPSAAIRAIKNMERYDLQYVEQPVPVWDIDGMAEVRRKVDTPIAADESCFTSQDALELIKKRAADIFTVRAEEAGGMLNCKKLVGIAEAAGIPCIMGTWGETGIAVIAKLHLVASSNNFPYANDADYPNVSDDILEGGKLPFKGGCLDVPNRPGLGVEIDRSKLVRYAFTSSGEHRS